MLQSLLLLGRQPALGLAELERLFGAEAVTPLGAHAALLGREPADVDFSRLGGAVKLCQVLTTYPATDFDKVKKQLSKDRKLFAFLPDAGKVTLGLSAFGFPISKDKLFAAGLTLKKILKTSERSVRLVPLSEGTALTSAQVIHNNLTAASSCELVIIKSSDSTIIGRTIVEQDIESYSRRDRDRPKRDSRVGMLPPKLAQIIVNLATGAQKDLAVLDPFCGTGVVLQEALLMGYPAYGTDLEPRMVEYSRKNLEWLISDFTPKVIDFKLETADATAHTWKKFDTVACESYLGRPFTSKPDPETLAKTAAECNLIIKKFLQNIHGQLPEHARLCVAVPAWQTAPNKFRHLPLVDSLEELGYNRVRFEHVQADHLLYYREDQTVARQLLVIAKK